MEMQHGVGWPAMSRRQETDLEKARRHVREGEARLERQAVIVSELELAGHEAQATLARQLLKEIRTGLKSQRWHLRYIETRSMK
jgi:hypothetical protein